MVDFRGAASKPGALAVAILVVALLIFTPSTGGVAASPASPPAAVDPAITSSLADPAGGGEVSVIVRLRPSVDPNTITEPSENARRIELVNVLRSVNEHSLQSLAPGLDDAMRAGHIRDISPLWIINGLSLKATATGIERLAQQAEVMSIALDQKVPAPAVTAGAVDPEAQSEDNLNAIGAPALWDLGFAGLSTVVASMDTGVDLSHPDIAGQWRAGSNSWFDPNGQHAAPADVNGHGTWTMGVMIGGDGGGSHIGVAPEARWIAVKIFDDSGTALFSRIHLGFQWLLDPDGDPVTDDAPNVVNNSWGLSSPGCNLEFQPDIQALLTGGILPVFAAGNYGPNGDTSISPANYPESLAVGAVDNSGAIYSSSSRGPSACGEAPTTYPDLVAPGVNIRTADLYSGFVRVTGTSLSAPHVAAGAALLRGAFPEGPALLVWSALEQSSFDLGAAGADNEFGKGLVDLSAAFGLLTEDLGQPLVRGDADCDLDVTTNDASLIAAGVTGLAEIPCSTAADANRDGTTSMADALIVSRLVLGLVDRLP